MYSTHQYIVTIRDQSLFHIIVTDTIVFVKRMIRDFNALMVYDTNQSRLFHIKILFFNFVIRHVNLIFFFFFNNPAPTEIYPLPLHDPLPISDGAVPGTPRLGPLQRLERARALLAQLPLESRHVDRLAAFGGDELREVDREAVGVVQLERLGTGDLLDVPELLQPLQAALDRVEESLLLGARDALEVGALLDQLRVDAPHHPADGMHEVHERGLAARSEEHTSEL